MRFWPLKRKKNRYPEIHSDIDEVIQQSKEERLALERKLNYIRREVRRLASDTGEGHAH